MKVKFVSLALLLLILITGVGVVSVAADGDDSIEGLKTVDYEKLKFKKNTDYMHDRKKVEQKNTIPTKQFDVHFDGQKQLPNRNDTSFLFNSAKRGEKNTTAVRASDLQLFTNSANEEPFLASEKPYEQKVGNTRFQSWLLIGVLLLGIIVLFTTLLPRLLQSAEQS